MRTKFTLAVGLTAGFLLGSKAGHRPYEMFVSGLRRLRNTALVSRPIEATAEQVSGFVRTRGEAMTDKAASSVYRKIAGVGQEPLVVEARITPVDVEPVDVDLVD